WRIGCADGQVRDGIYGIDGCDRQAPAPGDSTAVAGCVIDDIQRPSPVRIAAAKSGEGGGVRAGWRERREEITAFIIGRFEGAGADRSEIRQESGSCVVERQADIVQSGSATG